MNPNLFIWTSDWHLVSNDSESGGVGETHPTDAEGVAAYLTALDPAGVIDTGDCKDHYGAGSADELDRYTESVRAEIPWAVVNPGVNADYPILPGNHDELDDYNTIGAVTDFSPFDAEFWGEPYRWACDWVAPKVRFIAIHSYIHHSTDGLAGFFHVDSAERTWLQGQLDALPLNWQAIVCSHAPANTAFGNEIRSDMGGTELRTLLAANQSKIAAYLNGHRHSNMDTNVLSGIRHFNGPGMAYTIGNSNGGWVPITYDPAQRTLTFGFRSGQGPSYLAIGGYTPVVVQLPALVSSYSFSCDAAAVGGGLGSAIALKVAT